MLAIERQNGIISKIISDGKVLVNELSLQYNVTEETIRRDLEKIERSGIAKKTYGGAVKIEKNNFDLPFNVRRKSNIAEKVEIAKKAVYLISNGDSLVVDASSTALCYIKELEALDNLTIVTNSIEVLFELHNKENWKVFSTGGSVKKNSFSMVGARTCESIRNYCVDYAVCSCAGVSIDNGLTEATDDIAAIKREFFGIAAKKILLVDSLKFEKSSFSKVCPISELDYIVTDKKPELRWIEYCYSNNIELIY